MGATHICDRGCNRNDSQDYECSDAKQHNHEKSQDQHSGLKQLWLVQPVPVTSFKVQLLLAKSLRRCGLYEDPGSIRPSGFV